MKELSKSQVDEMTENFNNISSETDKNIQHVCGLLKNMMGAQKKPLSEITGSVQVRGSVDHAGFVFALIFLRITNNFKFFNSRICLKRLLKYVLFA